MFAANPPVSASDKPAAGQGVLDGIKGQDGRALQNVMAQTSVRGVFHFFYLSLLVCGWRSAALAPQSPAPANREQGKGLGFELVNRRSSKHLLGLRVGRSFAGEG